MGARLLVAGGLFWVTLLGSLPGYAQDLSAELKDVTWIGFQQFSDVSRVFVRTTEPVKYQIDAQNPNRLVLLLENARIPLINNTRQLDTRFFASPVGYILPKVIEGPSPSVRIEITLRQRVPYTEKQTDNLLAIDFKRN